MFSWPIRVTLQMSFFVGVLLVCQQVDAQSDGKTKVSVAELLQQLGSDDFQIRENATLALFERPDAIPLVEKALSSTDPEVRRRAARILKELKSREHKARIASLRATAQRGEIDLLIEHMVLQSSDIDDDLWQTVLDLVNTVTKAASKSAKKNVLVPNVNFMAGQVLLPGAELRDVVVNSRLLHADKFSSGGIDNSLVISQGAIHCDSSVNRSILLANGDVQITEFIKNTIVICDGDVAVVCPRNCVIIATGTVKVTENYFNTSIIIQNELHPLGLLHFFDPRDVGIEMTQDKGGVAIKKITAGKLFANRGLREGDQSISLNGTAVNSLMDFRRLLRKGVLQNQESRFSFQRADQKVEVALPLKDSELPKREPLLLEPFEKSSSAKP